MAYYDYLKEYTLDQIMSTALEKAPSDIDKRQGSIIYDAAAPFAVMAANLYTNLQLYYKNTDINFAGGAALDVLVGNYGMSRQTATYAVRKCTCKYDNDTAYNIPLGSRFCTISESSPIYFTATSKVSDGVFLLTCETLGTVGNDYLGSLLPVTQIVNLGSAILGDIVTPAQNTEDDEALRQRCIEWLRHKPYGGNVYHYKLWCSEYGGIGGTQVYPVWNGGGSVKLCIVDSQYNPCSPAFLTQLKEYFDPSAYPGQGLGVAPIGHNVTIVTPTEVGVTINASVLLDTGYTIEQVKSEVENKLKEYLESVKAKWDTASASNTYACAVYRSLVISNILQASHILNVASCTINGVEADLILTETGATQQIPKLTEVVLTSAS